LIAELVRLYIDKLTHHKTKLSEEEALRYYTYVTSRGCIYTYVQGGNILGFVETWRLSFEQFGRLICVAPFNIYDEDITTGPLCYVADTWIDPKHRNTEVVKNLKEQFFQRNIDAEFFCGEALRKKTQPVKVFKKQEAYEKWAKTSEVT